MLITKNITYHNHNFKAITDDTKHIDSHTLFVKTLQNQRYFNTLQQKPNIYIQAHNLKEIFSLPHNIIGITGTNGKTTTAAIIHAILLELGFSVALLGTRGFFINKQTIKPKGLTTPSVLELYENFTLAKECDFFVMEVSSHAIAQERIAGVEFSLKILSNITSDHLDFHKTLNEYIRVKNSFFTDTTPKLINADEPKAQYNTTNAYTYGIESKANLSVSTYNLTNGISVHLQWCNNNIKEDAKCHTKIFGKHNLYNILAALGAVKILTQEPLALLAQKLTHFTGVSGRMEVVSQKPLIIVDFAHTHDGMEQIFKSFTSHKIVVLFGAGGDRDKSKRPKMGAVAQKYAHRIYLTSDNPRSENPDSIIADIMTGIRDTTNLIIESDRKKALKQAVVELQENEVLLVLGKGDETYQIIGDTKLDFDDREIIADIKRELCL